MRTLTAVLVLSLASLTGCGFLKKADADAGSDAAVTADTSDAGSADAATATLVGKNSAQIARFPSETAMSQPMAIGQTSQPRTSPGAGTVVATLHAGTAVTRIATNGANQNLIVFPDPNVPTDNLMGWVTDAAFTAAVVAVHHDAGAATVTPSATASAAAVFACPPGKIAIQKPNTPVCRTPCAKDADCPSKKNCISQTSTANATVKACFAD